MIRLHHGDCRETLGNLPAFGMMLYQAPMGCYGDINRVRAWQQHEGLKWL